MTANKNTKGQENEKITALYCRLSQDDNVTVRAIQYQIKRNPVGLRKEKRIFTSEVLC